MKIEYDIEIPKTRRGRFNESEEYNILMKFVEGEHKSMCIEYADKKEARLKIACIRSHVKYRNINNIKVMGTDNKVYIIKEDESNK